MATFVLTDGRFFLNGFDMSSHTQSMTLDLTADEVDVTSINSGGFRSKIGGLQDASLTANGFFEAGADKPDGLLGVSAGAELIGTVSPTSSAGDTAYFLKFTLFIFLKLGISSISEIRIRSSSLASNSPLKIWFL